MLYFKNFYLLVIILFSNCFLSSIWIEPKDDLKIKKLELYTARNNINIQVISTSEIKISVLIDKKNTKKALIALHKEFKLDR